MNWNTLLSPARLGGQSITPNDGIRSVFDADFDRIAFSGGFRRLARKTQVHPFADDHVHNRLTHSLEVARVGRSLGAGLGRAIMAAQEQQNAISTENAYDMASIVSAACLAHDVGNPPFGHAGEDAMMEWVISVGTKFVKKLPSLTPEQKRDLELFDGNAQGFRMITQTENYLFDGGLRLTYATLATFLKYPWTSTHVTAGKCKFGAFLSEERIIKEVAERVGLLARGGSSWCRHPLAFLVEAADDICYSILDLEDAVEMNVLSYGDAKRILLDALDPATRSNVEKELGPDSWYRVNFARIRGPVFSTLIDGAIKSFMTHYDSIMRGDFNGELLLSLDVNDRRQDIVKRGKTKAGEAIYPTRRKVELELGSYAIFDSLLDAHFRAAVECIDAMRDPSKKISPKSALVLKLLGNHLPTSKNPPSPDKNWTHYTCMRRMVDYISGMTDNYAHNLSGKLRGNFKLENGAL